MLLLVEIRVICRRVEEVGLLDELRSKWFLRCNVCVSLVNEVCNLAKIRFRCSHLTVIVAWLTFIACVEQLIEFDYNIAELVVVLHLPDLVP